MRTSKSPNWWCSYNDGKHKMRLTQTVNSGLEWRCVNCIFRVIVMRWSWDIMIRRGRMAYESENPNAWGNKYGEVW